MAQETINEQLQRALFFCQMFNFGFGRAGLWGLHDPVAEGFTTFADAHLLFTMFLVDKGDKPLGGFIYPLLYGAGKADWMSEVIRVLNEQVGNVSFEEYLRKWRNKLATHGALSPTSLPDSIRAMIQSSDFDDRLLTLLDELRSSVNDLTFTIHTEVRGLESASKI
ncbi:MAG: hypothetical protein ABL970_10215 [Nitrospira sp.]